MRTVDLPRRSKAEGGKKILFPFSASFLSMNDTGYTRYFASNAPPLPGKLKPNIAVSSTLLTRCLFCRCAKCYFNELTGVKWHALPRTWPMPRSTAFLLSQCAGRSQRVLDLELSDCQLRFSYTLLAKCQLLAFLIPQPDRSLLVARWRSL